MVEEWCGRKNGRFEGRHGRFEGRFVKVDIRNDSQWRKYSRGNS